MGLYLLIFLSQIVLSIYVLYKTSGNKIYLFDGRLYFVVFHLLYGISFPFLYFIGLDPAWASFSELATEDNMRTGLLMYSSAIFALNCVFFLMPIKFNAVKPAEETGSKRKLFGFFPIALLFFLLLALLWHIEASGIQLFDLTVNRTLKLEALSKTLGFYLRLFIISLFYALIIHWEQLRKEGKFFAATLFLLYLGINLLLGNRRELLYVGSFYLMFKFYKDQTIFNLKYIPIPLLFLVVFTAMGTLRESQYKILPEQLDLAPKQTEFSSNFQSLTYVISESATNSPKMGETYLRTFSFLVPRFFWPDKPVSLSNEFGSEYGIAQIGISLVAEAVWNFGYLGPFLVYIFFGIILTGVFRFIQSQSLAYVYFLVYVQSTINANRGDFASIAVEILVSIVCIVVYKAAFK